MRRSLAWAVAVPLMLAGSQAAHALAYRIVYPQAHLRMASLVASGHGYLAWLPLVLGIGGAVVLVSFAATVADAARGGTPRALRAPAFALLPPLAFALQELLELSLHTGTFGWHAFAAPTFVPGLLLQLPVGALAYLVARLLLRAASKVGRLLAAARAGAGRGRIARRARLATPPFVRGTALRFAQRGPPLSVVG
jgi:hypothetical protein